MNAQSLRLSFLASRAALAWAVHSIPDEALQAAIDRANLSDPSGPLKCCNSFDLRWNLHTLIAAALSEAKRQVKGTQAYSHWCRANGLGDIPTRQRAEWRLYFENAVCWPLAECAGATEMLETVLEYIDRPESA
ncbi:hypothetical protein DF157_28280 [Burkholderia cenocepacia]|nr:hypothetical protein DF157_28280 [Burkholderia cenocepacia]